jgi:phosphoribosylglycinamide formyltransferase-1
MIHTVYDPVVSGGKMTIVCFISGSGTNYREIVKRDPGHRYLVFTNRPGCSGLQIARDNNHEIIEISHTPYLKDAVQRYGTGKIPRNCIERQRFEEDICHAIELKIGGQPDLICLAGYDQWVTDWLVDRYYPRILNVHPGDTTKGYDGLHWIPSAKAVIAGDKVVRSTLFFVDKGEDTGPVLVQSSGLSIVDAIQETEKNYNSGLPETLHKVKEFINRRNIKTYSEFKKSADIEIYRMMENICIQLQESLKVSGDWEIYPFAVHNLIARGRVAIDGRSVYIDSSIVSDHGYRLDE